MNLLLQCNQCGYTETGTSHGMLMNKIKMWNHLKYEHPMLAERMLKNHDVLPTSFYSLVQPAAGASPLGTMQPRWA